MVAGADSVFPVAVIAEQDGHTLIEHYTPWTRLRAWVESSAVEATHPDESVEFAVMEILEWNHDSQPPASLPLYDRPGGTVVGHSAGADTLPVTATQDGWRQVSVPTQIGKITVWLAPPAPAP